MIPQILPFDQARFTARRSCPGCFAELLPAAGRNGLTGEPMPPPHGSIALCPRCGACSAVRVTPDDGPTFHVPSPADFEGLSLPEMAAMREYLRYLRERWAEQVRSN